MFDRLLIANRGEIAVRIIAACRELGIEAVAVYSEADRHARHVAEADRAVAIGPAPATESYLSIDRIIAAARETGADAVHPGYGFLAENAALASACTDAGIVFVGPAPDAIERMGSKIEARRLMREAGVPVVPGETPPDQTDAGIRATVDRVGYPVLLKASAGGGGKGMRTVETPAQLEAALTSARRESAAAFGDDTIYVERWLPRPRHVEIQVVGDRHGQVVHLFERDCSTQRRHQKLVEESPSPAVTSRLRERMTEAAVAAAAAVDYEGAGTIEFLVEGSGDDSSFYFLEMNTRLQVEHPVTEAVTGVDLVAAQIRVAAGESVPWTQDQLAQRGHAIECRLYAEDSRRLLPQAGRLLVYDEPSGPGLRIDSGVRQGDEVSVHYDPLLAKLVVFAESRDAARARAVSALRRFPILGIQTNVALLIAILEHSSFIEATVDTAFVDRNREVLVAEPPAQTVEAALAAATAAAPGGQIESGPRNAGSVPTGASDRERATRADPWVALSGWRG